MEHRKAALIASLALLLSISAIRGTASAQEGGAESRLDEIIVTARYKEENLQDIPLSIAAFSTAALAQEGASNLTDIANKTAGLNFETYANDGFPVPTLRGLSATNIIAFENNVATFFGGIYLPRAYMIDVGLAGLQRVEVVKGPQSALYGRNAFSGAINYVPLAPPEEFMLDAFVTIGSDERRDYSVTIGGPIVEDRLAVVAGAVHSEFDGTWVNTHPNAEVDAGGTTGNMGGWDNDAYFIAATLTPTERAEITLGYNRSDKETEMQGRYGFSRNFGGTNCSNIDGVFQFFCGTFPVREAIGDPRGQGLNAESELLRLDADFNISDSVSVNYLFGDFDTDAYSYDQAVVNAIEGDAAIGLRLLGLPVGNIDGSSHELRLQWDRGGTQFAFGLYASDLDDVSLVEIIFLPPLGTDPVTPDSAGLINVGNVETNIDNKSIFVQASHDFGNGFDLAFEGRYTDEEKTQNDIRAGRVDSRSFTNFTPRIVGTWSRSDVSNVYFSAAQGVKSGGFNGGNILDSERSFDVEENWTYELGTKNSLYDGRLVLNAAVFFIDWTGLQTLGQSEAPGVITTVTRNIGDATSTGVELDVALSASDNLELNASLSLTDSEYGSDLIDPRYLIIRPQGSTVGGPGCDDVACPADGSIGGNDLPRQSKFQASAGFRYENELDGIENSSFWLGANVNHKSKQYLDPMTLTIVPDRTLFNLYSGVSIGRVSVEAWVRNLFDEEYVSSSTFNLSPPGEIRYGPVFGEKRTFGLTVRYSY